MNASGVSNGLAAIVATIADSVYLRATDADANTDVDHIDLNAKTIFIYNNLPTIPNAVSKSGYATREWPIEIRILRLANFDDNTVDGDTLRDICIAAADELYDKLPSQFNDNITATSVFTYEVDLLGEVKVYDKTLTGVRMRFVLNLRRDEYYC